MSLFSCNKGRFHFLNKCEEICLNCSILSAFQLPLRYSQKQFQIWNQSHLFFVALASSPPLPLPDILWSSVDGGLVLDVWNGEHFKSDKPCNERKQFRSTNYVHVTSLGQIYIGDKCRENFIHSFYLGMNSCQIVLSNRGCSVTIAVLTVLKIKSMQCNDPP